MKKRLLPISLAILMLLVFIPFGPAASASAFTASLLGQLDTGVSDIVPEWGIEDHPGNSVSFDYGDEVTIKMEFDEPIKFTGNWVGIATDVPVVDDDDAESTGAYITAFKLDGVDLGSVLVPLINRDNSGFLTIDIARQWGANYDDYGLADLEPYSTIEISFIVPNEGGGAGPSVDTGPITTDRVTGSGNAWIGGTFRWENGKHPAEVAKDDSFNDPSFCDWWHFPEQSVPFEIGVPFTVTLDMGSDKIIYDEAGWGGYIITVDSDLDVNPLFLAVYIDSIVVDGKEIGITPENVDPGTERGGLRVALNSGWTETPVVSAISDIGGFTKLEVTLAVMDAEDPTPFTGEGREPPAEILTSPPPEDVAPITEPPPAGGLVDPGEEIPYRRTDSDSDGLPGWALPVIIGGGVIAAGVVVFVIVKGRK